MYDGFGGAERLSGLGVVRVKRPGVVRAERVVAGVDQIVACFGLLLTAVFDFAIFNSAF